MDHPIVFQGRLDMEDLVHIAKYQGYLHQSRIKRMFGIIVLSMLVVFAAWMIYEKGPNIYLFLPFLAWVYLLVADPIERNWKVRRFYRKNEEKYLETRIALTADRVTIENEDHRSEYKWHVVGLIADTPDGLLFRNQAEVVLFWLPERVIESSQVREQVLALAASNDVIIRRLP